MINHVNSEIFELCSYYHQLCFIQYQDFARNHEINKEIFWKDMIYTSNNDLRQLARDFIKHLNYYFSLYIFIYTRNIFGNLWVLVYFRNELKKVVSVFDKSNENILCIKIGKNSLKNKSNTHIAYVYNSSKNLTYAKENECNVLQFIEEQLVKFSESNQIIIGGNFNSRIVTKADFIAEDRKDLDFLPEGYELDTFTTHRNNEDVSLNSFGEQLIQLCIASKLRVLNGRTRRDLQGHFT